MTQEATSARVMALVLTYNAPETLSTCVAAIRNQTRPPDDLIVIDNASRPQASIDHSNSLGSVHRNVDNLGPAGGHAVGLDLFLQSGFDVAWVMDDDCTPESRCLELLLASRSEAGPSLTFPKWIDQRTGVVTNYPAWCGFLIPREIVVAVGLPRSEFFWWMEDTEYLQWRIPRAGFEITRTPDAVVWHSAIRRGATKPGWKFYYETRNAVYYRLHVQRRNKRTFYWLARVFIRTPIRILLQENHKTVKLALFVRGAFDGLFGRLGIRVPSDEKPEPRTY